MIIMRSKRTVLSLVMVMMMMMMLLVVKKVFWSHEMLYLSKLLLSWLLLQYAFLGQLFDQIPPVLLVC